MCGKKGDEGEYSQGIHSLQGHQEQFFPQQQYSEGYVGGGGGGGGGRASSLPFPEVSPLLPWTFPQVLQQPYNQQVHFLSNPTHGHDPFHIPPPTSSSYGGLFNTRPPSSSSSTSSLQFAYQASSSNHPLRMLSDSRGQMGHHRPGSTPFGGLQPAKMTAQEIMDAKALAASRSHSEAERRRRERINNHLAKLRSLLPSTTKTDKASLLAEVIQHVKELKRQTSQIAEGSPVPSETDELTVDASDEDGKLIIKASLCCEDRSDLLPELIKTLKALKLRTLKAEITTLGGRVKNVLFISGVEEQVQPKSNIHEQELQQQQVIINSIQEALKAVMERICGDDSSSASSKRQRTNLNIYT